MLNAQQDTNALTVFTRLAQRQPEKAVWLEQVLTENLEALAESAVAVAIETGDPIGSILAKVLHTSAHPSLAYQLYDQIPTETVALREVAVEAIRQCLEDQRHGGENGSPPTLARLLNNLAGRLSR